MNRQRNRMHSDKGLLPFVVPLVAVMLVLTAYPAVYALAVSFQSGTTFDLEFVGLGNYKQIFLQDERFLNSVKVTLTFTVVSVTIQLVAGMLLALGLHEYSHKRQVLRTGFMIPMMITPVVIALTFGHLFFNPTYGLLNFVLSRLGMQQIVWLSSRRALWSIVAVDVWEWTPFVTIILLAGLQSLPIEPFEAARIDGAGPMRTFFGVTLPLLSGEVAVAAVLRLMDSLRTFDTIMGMTGGGPGTVTETVNIYTYHRMFRYNQFGYASALAMIMLLLGLALTFVLTKTLKRNAWDR